jgi:hypothetical protein
MKKFSLAALALLVPLTAYAASAEDPVNHIMDIAKARWEENSSGGDYFDQTTLGRDFSSTFVKAYEEASKFPAYDDGSSNPFDYDVITASQDGCPLKDVTVASEGAKDGVDVVNVSFKLWTCADSNDPSRDRVSQLKFDVITENGKPVIDDIHRQTEGKWDSLVAEMRAIAKGPQ